MTNKYFPIQYFIDYTSIINPRIFITMLCPDITNFPPPKVITFHKINQNIDSVKETVKLNNFYKSIIITCPDETHVPSVIEEIISEDSEYYKLNDCPLSELVDPVFIKSFVKNGALYCFTVDKNCIVDNCVAITPDGILTLHILEFIYQTLGIEGLRRPNNYYEVKIDLKHLKNFDKLKHILGKLGKFDFYVIWEPSLKNICPSSIAKYFHEKCIIVTICTLKTKIVAPEITEVPSLEGAEIDEIVEWVGMVSHDANLSPDEPYISTYSPPESAEPLQTSRLSILIVKGFLTPTLVMQICDKLLEHVSSRILSNYWASVSIQSEETLWKWNNSTPRIFQSHNSSTNIFFTKAEHIIYTIAKLQGKEIDHLTSLGDECSTESSTLCMVVLGKCDACHEAHDLLIL